VVTAVPELQGPDLQGWGTPEHLWRASGVLDALPVRDAAAVPLPGRAVVVAPHPDDEVLGVGGLLATWAARGVEVVVVAVTDGDGSHPGSPTLHPDELVARRREERAAALDRLGLGAVTVVSVGLPDGGVERRRGELTHRLVDVLRPGDLCLAPRPDDGHPDHDAAGAAARRATTVTGTRLAGFAVWLWHWARPDEPGVSWADAVRVPLPEWAHTAKRAAVACFTTQVAPLSDDPRDAVILPPFVLERLTREFEVLWWM